MFEIEQWGVRNRALLKFTTAGVRVVVTAEESPDNNCRGFNDGA